MVIKHLDYFVLKTLDHLRKWKYPQLKIKKNSTNLFLGSGNAENIAWLFVEKFNGFVLNASNYKRFFQGSEERNFASINIISASGAKDSVEMASFLSQREFFPNLITCNKEAPAKKFIKEKNVFVFPSFREPPTYNVSTYSSMIYWLFKEDISAIKKIIKKLKVLDLRKYKYIFFLAADKYTAIAKMATIKVLETLAGIGANGDGLSNSGHGMLIQPNKNRLIFCLNQKYDAAENVFHLNLDSYLGLLLVTYYIIGKNQTGEDTKNILENYFKNAKARGWQFNKVW